MKKERGNILFLILLAVVLFAALSYAVTSSMRGGGTDASNEKGQAQTADLMNYFAQLDLAVQRMTASGIKDYELNFYYQTNYKFVSGTYDNTNCTESRCRVFDPAGGGVSGRPATDFGRSTSYPPKIALLSIPGVGTSAPDIVYVVMAAYTNLCLGVNKQQLGLNDMVYNATHTLSTNVLYENAFTGGPYSTTSLSPGVPITQSMGLARTYCACPLSDRVSCETGTWPIIYHVLVER